MTQQEVLLERAALSDQKFDGPGPSSISVTELLTILNRRRRVVYFPALVLAGAASLVVPFLRDSFTAEAVVMPPQQAQSSLSAFASGALGGLAGTGLASQIGLKSPADLYIGLLKSRTISDDIIARFGLGDVYKTKLASETRVKLSRHALFTSRKDSLLSISVEDHDPKRAAAIANAFIDELYKENSRLAVSDAGQRRMFFQQRLSKEKEDLSDSELALKNTQNATGLVVPGGQAEVLLHSAAQLRAEISVREVSLQAIRSYATDENAQIHVLKREISTLQGQLAQLESKNSASSPLEMSAGNLPTANLAFIRRFRDVKYHETLYELLSKQYEAALIDEAKASPFIQVVDPAIIPDQKSGPRRLPLVLDSGLVGLVLGSMFVFVSHKLKRGELSDQRI